MVVNIGPILLSLLGDGRRFASTATCLRSLPRA